MKDECSKIILTVLGISKGATSPGIDAPIYISRKQLEEVEKKCNSKLTGNTTDARINELLGICKSMGVILKKDD